MNRIVLEKTGKPLPKKDERRWRYFYGINIPIFLGYVTDSKDTRDTIRCLYRRAEKVDAWEYSIRHPVVVGKLNEGVGTRIIYPIREIMRDIRKVYGTKEIKISKNPRSRKGRIKEVIARNADREWRERVYRGEEVSFRVYDKGDHILVYPGRKGVTQKGLLYSMMTYLSMIITEELDDGDVYWLLLKMGIHLDDYSMGELGVNPVKTKAGNGTRIYMNHIIFYGAKRIQAVLESKGIKQTFQESLRSLMLMAILNVFKALKESKHPITMLFYFKKVRSWNLGKATALLIYFYGRTGVDQVENLKKKGIPLNAKSRWKGLAILH